jgi:hypothetical protein
MMTAIEWTSATDPEPMLRFLHGKVSEHPLRSFAVACCRRVLPLLPDERSRRAIEAADRFAHDEISRATLESAALDAKDAYKAAQARTLSASAAGGKGDLITEGEALLAEGAAQAAYIVADMHFAIGSALAVVYCAAEAATGLKPPNSESAVQAQLLRECIAYPGVPE